MLGDAEVAIEVKGTPSIHSRDTRNLLEFRKEYPEVKELILICREENVRRTDEGVWIMPYLFFLERLWTGNIGLPCGFSEFPEGHVDG